MSSEYDEYKRQRVIKFQYFQCQQPGCPYSYGCEHEHIYALKRFIIIYTDSEMNRETNLQVSIEDEEIPSMENLTIDACPVEEPILFGMTIDNIDNDDEDVSSFEVVGQFLIRFFGVEREVNDLKNALVRKKKFSKVKKSSIDKKELDEKQITAAIQEIRKRVTDSGKDLLVCGSKEKLDAVKVLNKLGHVIIQLHIRPLLNELNDASQKENVHMTRKTANR